MKDLQATANHFKEKLSKIRVFLTDVDGVLTNGEIFWVGEEVGFTRKFNTQDGFGMRFLLRNGLQVGFISGGDSESLKARIKTIDPTYAYMGNEDKVGAFEEIVSKSGCSHEEILYIGDELFDLPVLKRVGFSVTVADAPPLIKEQVDYVTTRRGGEGAVREVVDLVCLSQGLFDDYLREEN